VIVNVLGSISDLSELPGPVVLAIGVFDGFHLGHRAVVERAISDARAAQGTPVVVTFDPHPAAILRPQNAPPLLTSTRHKLKLFGDAGVRHALVLQFTQEFASKAPENFVAELAAACRPLREICVGEDWAFGKGRAGDLALLSSLGERFEFTAVGLPAVTVEGRPVSSTGIRAALENGELELAGRLLGRDFSVLGTVAEGRKLGRTLGVPTANVRPESEQLPPNGVYAVRIALDGRLHSGIANVGVRPTISPEGIHRLVEVHLFDFSGELYGRDMEVSFLRFVRPEKKFPGLDALRAQIASDVASVRASLAG
jgi:riboflavin kinase / FMN adenylyltransferase